MNVLTRTTRRASLRAVVAVTAVALTAGAALVPAANAALVPAAPATVGLFGSAEPTYSVFPQSLAILGLHAAGQPVPASAVTWLKNQQCTDGGFGYFDPTPDGSCRVFDYNDWSSGEDVDSTAVAAQALRAVGELDAAEDAEAFLVDQQNADGGWESPVGSGYGTNVNSSALALMALKAAGVPAEVNPAPFFAAKQIGRTVVADDAGDLGSFGASWAPTSPNVLATIQGVPGIGGADLIDVPAPAVSGWQRDVDLPVGTPAATSSAIADWASDWLSTQGSHVDFNGESGYRAWAILSFATTKTGLTAARAQYAKLVTELDPTDPGKTGLAALAATALRETTDAQKFATLTAATLTPASGRDSNAPASWTLSAATRWVGQAVALNNPYAGTTLPITQNVAWGDGTTSTVTGLTTNHTYKSAGVYRPVVTVTYVGFDRSADVTVAAVTVKKDTTAPTVKLTVPSSSSKVSSWKTIRGTATDNALGVQKVTVHLVEKRGSHWYSYNGTTWTKRSSFSNAVAKAKRIQVTPTSTGAWSLKVNKLAQGSLNVRYAATDKANNSTSVRAYTAKLTKA